MTGIYETKTRFLTEFIRSRAEALGFAAVGFSRAEPLAVEADRLQDWLGRGRHAEMTYLSRRSQARCDPLTLLPEVRTVVSLTHNYYDPVRIESPRFAVARYASGRDYHQVLKKKLKRLATAITDAFGPIRTRLCVDSAPILEKAWAQRAGLGWIGKNGCLISPRRGSYHFLAEILLDAEAEYDAPMRDHCGRCRRCLDACPTGALVEPYVIDSRRCLSYLTKEYKGDLPSDIRSAFGRWILGCDICQEVCPINRFSRPHDEPDFNIKATLSNLSDEDFRNLTVEQFDELFRSSAVRRIGYTVLKRNIDFVDRPDRARE